MGQQFEFWVCCCCYMVSHPSSAARQTHAARSCSYLSLHMTQWESEWPLWKRRKQDITTCVCYSSNLCLLTAHPLSTLTVCVYSRDVISCISNWFRCLLPLKSASRFFLCCGLKWREMAVVFSHFPNWSPASASNVNVLTEAIRNKTVITNMRLNSSTLRNLNNFHWALWPVMFQEVQKYSNFMSRVHVYLIPHR